MWRRFLEEHVVVICCNMPLLLGGVFIFDDISRILSKNKRRIQSTLIGLMLLIISFLNLDCAFICTIHWQCQLAFFGRSTKGLIGNMKREHPSGNIIS